MTQTSIINVPTNSQIGTLPTPRRVGYRFMGWYTGITDGIRIDENYTPTSNITIYAQWRLSPSEVDFAT